jgi:polyphosphate kinase
MPKRKSLPSHDKTSKHLPVMRAKPKAQTKRIWAEASWLSFNRRVLLQTERPDFPLLERLKFLGIWANNLDEFFAARVSRAFLQQRSMPEYQGLLSEARDQANQAVRAYLAFLPKLEQLGLRILEPKELSRAEGQYFGAYLAEEIAPRTDLIGPEALTQLASQALYFAAGDHQLRYLIRLPGDLPRLLPIPGREGAYVRLGALVRMRSDLFLPERGNLHEFRLIRLAQLERSRVDWDELPAALEKRLDGVVSHLELEMGFPGAWAQTLQENLGLQPGETFELAPPLDLSFVLDLAQQHSGPKFPPHKPDRPKKFLSNPWAYLEERDLLLFHPYQDYRVIEDFVLMAAKDPKVDTLRATLYRIGPENRIAEALIQAAKNGKDVAVLLEGRARFDELSNLRWSLRLQGAGVRVLPLPGRKVHAKALLIRRSGRGYTHLGTGNYNATNGALYTDLSLFSSENRIAREVEVFFRSLEERQAPEAELSLLKTGPEIRQALLEAIEAEAHPKGHIILKFNHLTDPALLQALGQAAEAGAKVELIVRSTLTVWHPKFKVRSLVGRFLEHARIAACKNGGKWRIWATSADAMPRNLERRLELFFPILNPRARRKVLDLLQLQLKDNRNTFVLEADGQRAVWGGKRDGQKL